MAGCQAASPAAPEDIADGSAENSSNESKTVNITFIVEIPEELKPQQELMIEFLDEITGLAIVPVRFPMEKIDGRHYQLTRDLPDRSIIKYRFFRKGDNPSVEYNSLDLPVRYRFIFTPYARKVHDLVAGWNDVYDNVPSGMIEGKITNSQTGEPAAGLLIACGGDQVISSADGSYRFEYIKPGHHNLSVMSMDGSFYPFMQEAVVAINSRTPADIQISPAQFSTVKFVLNADAVDTEDYPIRIIGDLSQAGNTFSNQGADQSVLADLAPVMEMGEEGYHQAFLQLPKGMVFTYKYSLGDGLWNSERDANGALHTRKLLVTDDVQMVLDELLPVAHANTDSILFRLRIPENTPPDDSIAIQFNPFDWSPPLPMEKSADGMYHYTLFGPQDLLGEISYRYCRNNACDNIFFSTNGAQLAQNGIIQSKSEEQSISDEIPEWTDLQPVQDPTIVFSTEPIPRIGKFIAGFEIQPGFPPALMADYEKGLSAIATSGASTLLLTPTWQIVGIDSLVVRQTPGLDLSMGGISHLSNAGRLMNQQIGLYPRILSDVKDRQYQPGGLANVNANKWNEAVKRFYTHFAIVARLNSAQILIVDGNYLDWRNEPGMVELLITIRSQFRNRVFVSATPTELEWYPETMLEQFDGIYLLLGCPLYAGFDQEEGEPPISIPYLLDGKTRKMAGEKGMPVIVGILFPATENPVQTCFRTSSEWTEIMQEFPLLGDTDVNLLAQNDLYNDIFSAVATREWITGVISRGYALESARTDSSPSVHGKPAADILWYWFSKLRN